MKKVTISIIVILVICVSSASIAASMFNTTNKLHEAAPIETKILVRPGAMKVDVFIGAFEKPGLTIQLCNANGKVLAQKRIGNSDKTTGVRFNMSELKDGNYHVVILRGKNKQVHTVELKTFFPEPSFYRVLSLKEKTL